MKEILLNISGANYIDLPDLEKPKEKSKPIEYWNIFNKAELLYKSKDYLEAKEEFLKILKYPDPHKSFKLYLLRTFRKIIKEQIENNDLKEAYVTFIEFFDVCKSDITNTDIRKYNRLVNVLNRKYPDSNYHEMELKNDPEIFIDCVKEFPVNLVNETRFKKDKDPRIRFWNKLFFEKYFTIYSGREENVYFIKIRGLNGDIRSEYYPNHSIFHLSSSFNSDKFIISSDDLILYLYSINYGVIKKLDLSSIIDDKYHLRNIDISSDGNFILFSCQDKAYLLNKNLDIIAELKTPIAEPSEDGWEKRTYKDSVDYAEINKNLSVLGMSGNPDYTEIKKRFKKLVLEFHPDRNRENPAASEKLKQIISSYEYLTGESAETFFKESGDEEFYYKSIYKSVFNVPNSNASITTQIGLISKGKDWIYATYLDDKGSKIYLGCYSGKLYSLSKEGIVDIIINCHDTVKSIIKKHSYLFIETNYHLYILKDNEYLTHLKLWKEGILSYLDGYIILRKTNEIKLFSLDGIYISSIRFKNRINDLYQTNRGLNISTTNKTYEIEFEYLKFYDNPPGFLYNDKNYDLEINSLICNLCNTENPYYSIYCQECGETIETDTNSKISLNTTKQAFCPYCNKFLKEKPKRKKKCPFCKNFIYVRTSPKNREKILLTEEGTKKIEEEWKKVHRKNKFLRKFKQYGITENDFKKHQISIVGKTNSDSNDFDIIKSIYNEVISKNNDYHTLKMIHYQMALYLNEEGKNHFRILQEASRMELLNFKQRGVNNVTIITAGEQSCQACQKQENKIFTIDDAIQKMPIPCKKCSYQLYKDRKGFCRCNYGVVYI